MAVAHRGGPVRALDRRMPAFGDALSTDQIERAVKYLWTFCADPAWPRGDLNLPRAFFTEKAFPENETVWTTGVTASGAKAVENELVYEHRIGSRWQYELRIPFGGAAGSGRWPVETGARRRRGRAEAHALRQLRPRQHLRRRSRRASCRRARRTLGLGNGFTIYEPFAMWGQIVGSERIRPGAHRLRVPVGSHAAARTRASCARRSATRSAQDQGFGRAWSPMLEVLVAAPEGGRRRVGCGAADAGVAEQAAARPAQRRRTRPAQPA